jgi:ribosome-associated protein
LSDKHPAARAFAVAAARLAADTHCTSVVALDLTGIWGVADYFILATGTSARQMRSVSNDIEELAKTMGYDLYRTSGQDGESWIASDYVHVVVHVFSAAARHYYDLDNLWGDARRLNWEKESRPPAKSRSKTKSTEK